MTNKCINSSKALQIILLKNHFHFSMNTLNPFRWEKKSPSIFEALLKLLLSALIRQAKTFTG